MSTPSVDITPAGSSVDKLENGRGSDADGSSPR